MGHQPLLAHQEEIGWLERYAAGLEGMGATASPPWAVPSRRCLPERHASKAAAALTGVQIILWTFEREAPLASTPTLIQTVNVVNVRDLRRGEPLPLRTKQAMPA